MSSSAALPQGQHGHAEGHGHHNEHAEEHGHAPDHGDEHAHAPEHEHEHGHGHGQGHGGVRGALLGLLRPHSHDAADSVDEALESTSEGIRAVKVGLVGLGLTGALQVVVALVSSSVALLADTIHNLADALTSLPLWVAFVLVRRPASRRYTYGLGRAEDLAGIAIIAVIAASAVVAGWESVRRLSDPRPVEHLGWVIAAGLVGFAGNELVASYRIRVGRTIGSAALVADGLHARTDGMTSLAVVVGALGVALGWRRADPIVGAVITVAILVVLRGAAVQIYRRLMDAVDPELVDAAEVSLRATPGVEDVVELRLRWIGHRIRAEVGIVVDASATLLQAHDIAEDARHRLLHDVPRLDDATVHVDPTEVEGMDHHAPTAHHRRPG